MQTSFLNFGIGQIIGVNPEGEYKPSLRFEDIQYGFVQRSNLTIMYDLFLEKVTGVSEEANVI